MLDAGFVVVHSFMARRLVTNHMSMHHLLMFVGMDVLEWQQTNQSNRESGGGRD